MIDTKPNTLGYFSYFLLKDKETGEPMEMLACRENVSKKDIQEAVDKARSEYASDETLTDCFDSELEYVLSCLWLILHVETIPWSNDDNIYF